MRRVLLPEARVAGSVERQFVQLLDELEDGVGQHLQCGELAELPSTTLAKGVSEALRGAS